LFIDTITGTNRLAVPAISGQSLFMDTITGTNLLSVPIISGQSLFMDTITGTNRLSVPIISGQSLFIDTITGANLYITRTNIQAGRTGNILIQDLSSQVVCSLYSYIDVSGNITANSFNSTSDYRVKQNVEPVGLSEYPIDSLRPVKYYNLLSQKDDIGFIAHELQEHLPLLVNGEKDGPDNQSINYIGLIPILVSEIQELKTQLKHTQTKLQQLYEIIDNCSFTTSRGTMKNYIGFLVDGCEII
jgi:uncharacterized protein with FMN-binding domain